MKLKTHTWSINKNFIMLLDNRVYIFYIQIIKLAFSKKCQSVDKIKEISGSADLTSNNETKIFGSLTLLFLFFADKTPE